MNEGRSAIANPPIVESSAPKKKKKKKAKLSHTSKREGSSEISNKEYEKELAVCRWN